MPQRFASQPQQQLLWRYHPQWFKSKLLCRAHGLYTERDLEFTWENWLHTIQKQGASQQRRQICDRLSDVMTICKNVSKSSPKEQEKYKKYESYSEGCNDCHPNWKLCCLWAPSSKLMWNPNTERFCSQNMVKELVKFSKYMLLSWW